MIPKVARQSPRRRPKNKSGTTVTGPLRTKRPILRASLVARRGRHAEIGDIGQGGGIMRKRASRREAHRPIRGISFRISP